ncbi:hypothetical protein [Nonomuraea cavernae]|nr:hypothetical protein [Nonomuraea cavernae]MCA2184869.1 hypothetical protein [Nonomuraea cavernae]
MFKLINRNCIVVATLIGGGVAFTAKAPLALSGGSNPEPSPPHRREM